MGISGRYKGVVTWAVPLLVVGTLVMAQENPGPQEDPFNAFGAIRGFGKIELALYGDAERSGLSNGELQGFIKGRILESFKGMEVVPLPQIPLNYTDERAIRDYSEKLYRLGYVYVEIFVVGGNYPVAYHIRFRFGNCLYMDESKKWAFWEREALGFTSRKDLKGDVMGWLAKLTKKMAEDFNDRRGD